jgi:hypothetical protein
MKPIKANKPSNIVLTLLDSLADSDNLILLLLLFRGDDGETTITFFSLVGLAVSTEVSAGSVGSASLSCPSFFFTHDMYGPLNFITNSRMS